ncbi:MAG TPA: hypothetical protein VFN70_02895, partial [Burkholderiales bacterium]|nr:hypothetical protein [Burkholderiales bacterium]
NAAGEKLSKQTRAPPIDRAGPGAALVAALEFLGQRPEPRLVDAPAAEILAVATARWDRALIPRVRALRAGD